MKMLTEQEIRQYAPSVFATEAHESRSERFAPIATIDIIRALEKENFVPVLARQSRTRDLNKRDYTRHMIRFRPKDGDMSRVLNKVYYEIVLTNANDGTASYKLRPGMYCLICLNGMTIETASFEAVCVRHMGNPQQVIENVIDATYTVVDEGKNVLRVAEEWPKIELSEGVQQEFARVAHRIRFNGKVNGIDPVDMLRANRVEDKGPDLWRTYQRLQENGIKGGLEGRNPETHRRVSTRQVRGIDQDVKYNVELFKVAQEIEHMLRG